MPCGGLVGVGGFTPFGGHMGPLFQPIEVLMICRAASGNFIASNTGKAIGARAQASRRELVAGGLDCSKLLRVGGMADILTAPNKDSRSPINRRIELLILYPDEAKKIRYPVTEILGVEEKATIPSLQTSWLVNHIDTSHGKTDPTSGVGFTD